MLSKEDDAAGNAAANKLPSEDQAEPGKSKRWTGPTSGSYDMEGHGLPHLNPGVRYKKAPAAPRTLNVCRLKTGEWKLM